MTRFRADAAHVHTPLGREYYAQRAASPGTLLVTEGTFIAPQAGGFANVPGIWNDAQIAAWRKIADAVHAKGGVIFMQLWALGRAARPPVLESEGRYDLVGPSAIPMDAQAATPRALSTEEVRGYVAPYAQAARNAVEGAGVDGVEIHAANGYLPDQFLQIPSNARTDAYGGSAENRIRFVAEVVDAVQAAVGPERTALRVSPWSSYWGMRMDDPIPTFAALVQHLADKHPALAYLHVVEPRANGDKDAAPRAGESNAFVADIWAPRPLVRAGGYTRELAIEAAEREGNVLVAVGRHFTANPDLVERWRRGVPLAPYERATFYAGGARGYSDWPSVVEDKL